MKFTFRDKELEIRKTDSQQWHELGTEIFYQLEESGEFTADEIEELALMNDQEFMTHLEGEENQRIETMPIDDLIAFAKQILENTTPGPWWTPHLSDDAAKCDCTSVLEERYAGGIASIHVDNGATGNGGNDCPPKSEAAANGKFIALSRVLIPELIKRMEGLIPKLSYRADTTYLSSMESAYATFGSSPGVSMTESTNDSVTISPSYNWVNDFEVTSQTTEARTAPTMSDIRARVAAAAAVERDIGDRTFEARPAPTVSVFVPWDSDNRETIGHLDNQEATTATTDEMDRNDGYKAKKTVEPSWKGNFKPGKITQSQWQSIKDRLMVTVKQR